MAACYYIDPEGLDWVNGCDNCLRFYSSLIRFGLPVDLRSARFLILLQTAEKIRCTKKLMTRIETKATELNLGRFFLAGYLRQPVLNPNWSVHFWDFRSLADLDSNVNITF